MIWIKRLKDKPKPKKKKTTTYTARDKERQQLYQRSDYRKAVDLYKQKHIWCCDCMLDGVFTPGRDLHHLRSPFDKGLSDDEKLDRLYDESNWVLLCNFHHRLRHHTATKGEILNYQDKVNKIKNLNGNKDKGNN